MFVKEILRVKGSQVFTIPSTANVSDVVNELIAHNCGSSVVSDGDRMIGIISERDILRACAAMHDSLEDIPLRPLMSRNVITVSPMDKVGDVMGMMTEHRVRHLPVMESGELIGLISIGDVVKAQHAELTTENQLLKEYIQS